MSTDIDDLTERLRDFSRGRDDIHSRAANVLEDLNKEVNHWWRMTQRWQEENRKLKQEVQRYRGMLALSVKPDDAATNLLPLHNEARARSGWFRPLPPLQPDSRLNEYAQIHVLKMANGLGLQHSLMANVLKLGFSRAGENIAYGQETAQAVMTSWLWSPGHRANILARTYTHMGCAARKDANNKLYWCVVFGTP